MVLGFVRENVRPARLVGDKNGTKPSQQEENAPNRAILGVQGEFYTENAAARLVQGEFYTENAAARLVQGEFCTGMGGVWCVLGELFRASRHCARSCWRRGAVHVGGCGGFASLGAGWRRVAGVSDL